MNSPPNTPAGNELNFRCPHCNLHIVAESAWAGLETKCPTCHEAFIVPGSISSHQPAGDMYETKDLCMADLSVDERSQVNSSPPSLVRFAILEREGGREFVASDLTGRDLTGTADLLRKLDLSELKKIEQSIHFGLKGDQSQSDHESAEWYKKAFEINPYDDVAIMSYGVCLAVMGQLDEGIKHVRKATQVNPNNKRARANLAQMEADLNTATSKKPHGVSCRYCGKDLGNQWRYGFESKEVFAHIAGLQCPQCGIIGVCSDHLIGALQEWCKTIWDGSYPYCPECETNCVPLLSGSASSSMVTIARREGRYEGQIKEPSFLGRPVVRD